jgi:hypothetical protein
MDERLLARYHTLSENDLVAVVGKRRRPETKLGFAVQLCYLRFPGRPLPAGETPPGNLLHYVAAQLDEDSAAFDEFAKSRDTTRREHLSEIVRTFGFRPFDAEARRELYEHLLPVAMGTDRGMALVEAAIEDTVGWERFVESIEEAEELALPADFDYLEHLEGQYRRLRGYAPALLETFEFSAAPPADPLLEAVGVLREMSATGKRKVPDDAPTSFVKPRWERHVFDGGGIDRRYYEMSAITELKNGLKSGDVWVPGSRKYADFEDYLLPRSSWERMRAEGGPPVAINPNLEEYLQERSEELRRELSEVERLISRGKLRDVRLEDGELRFKRAKTSVPKGMKELTQKHTICCPPSSSRTCSSRWTTGPALPCTSPT